MQRVVIILVSSVALLAFGAGCTKEGPSDSSLAIGYQAGVWDGDSKATVTDGGNISSRGDIQVYSYLMNGTEGVVTGNTFFNAELANSGGVWDSEPQRYWPSAAVGVSASKSLSFFAFQPSDASVTGFSGDSYLASSNSKPTFTYTTPAVSQQKDLIYAASEFNTYHGCTVNGQIDFNFNHALAKIGFFGKVVGSGSDIVLTSVKLTGVYPTARFDFGSGWSNYSGTRADYYALTTDDTPITLSFTDQNIMGADQYMFLIPQSLTGVGVEIVYTVDGGAPVTKQIPLSGSWSMGQGAALNLNYSAADARIDITLSIVSWTEMSINTTIN